MAEARRAIDPFPALTLDVAVDPSNARLQAHLSEKGVSIFIPKPGYLAMNLWGTVKRFYKKMHQAFMPLPVPVVFTLVLGTVSYMTLTPHLSKGNRGIRDSWLSNFVWRLDTWVNPFARGFHNELRVAYLSFYTSITILFAGTFAHRGLLRGLLSYTGWMEETRGPRSLKTKIWGALLKYLYIRGGSKVMLAYQTSLPNLPLPALKDTIDRYMESMQPLLNNLDERQAVEAEVQSFLANEGPKLQKYLTYKWWMSSNYISQWWLDFVYLRGRDSLMINSNFYGMGLDMPVPTTNQAARAAYNAWAMLQIAYEVENELIPPMLIQGLVPMCMQQYVNAFATTRIPQLNQDKLVHYSDSHHILVMHKGRYFKLRGLTSARKPVSILQLYDAFEGILADVAVASEHEVKLGALTAWDRNLWATTREECFLRNPLNRSALDSIERALFVLCLDDHGYDHNDYSKLGNFYIHGETGANRWFDKSANICVAPDGYTAINVEHSWADAPCFGHCFELTMARELKNGNIYRADGTLTAETTRSATLRPIHPERITFHLTESLKSAIDAASQYATGLITDLDLQVRQFQPFGKNIMKTMKCSPDAFVQMALQLAYYRNQGKFVQTYESAMARLFVEGRTETIRSCTKESAAFVLAMNDATKTKEERKALLVKACSRHTKLTTNAMTGRGVDRHLFALYVVSVGTGTESPFLKRALGRGWKLSTSQTPMKQSIGEWPNEKLEGEMYPRPGGGFGPVADDGFGVSYCIHGEKQLFFHISSKRSCPTTSSESFGDSIFQALEDMATLQ